jgi:hypothetical protein
MKTPTTRRINPKATMRSASSIVYRGGKEAGSEIRTPQERCVAVRIVIDKT